MMTNTGNRLTQGQFSYLPDLTDKQISQQLEYALGCNWSIGIEYTDDPHPRAFFSIEVALPVTSPTRATKQRFLPSANGAR